MDVNSLPKTVTRQRRDCDLNAGLLRLRPARYPLGYRATHIHTRRIISRERRRRTGESDSLRNGVRREEVVAGAGEASA